MRELACGVVVTMFTVACGSSSSPTGTLRNGDPVPDASSSMVARNVARDAAPPPDAGRTPPEAGRAPITSIREASAPAPVDAAPAPDASTAADAALTWTDACGHTRPDVFADAVVSFTPGPSAGFGEKNMPCVVLGPPVGAGLGGGSLDVVSLGKGGSIVLEFDDVELTDEPGPDLLVFENAFPGWAEPGFVAVSDDGNTWSEWPCNPEDAADNYPHCAGVSAVLSNPMNGIDPTDPSKAGGDAFDLADLGVATARFVRIRDGGAGQYSGTSGGFDLDAIAAVHSTPRSPKR
ncbi:MAG TPA: hypothetical protein VHC69_30520 [Polyangiaceae bacterium]|nr:hypothetical protein [Polyangiaceae bacterium]